VAARVVAVDWSGGLRMRVNGIAVVQFVKMSVGVSGAKPSWKPT